MKTVKCMSWSMCYNHGIFKSLFIRGGSGLSPTRARARPSRFFDVFRVPEPEVFESGLGPTWPEPERKARGYPKITFLQSRFLQLTSIHSGFCLKILKWYTPKWPSPLEYVDYTHDCQETCDFKVRAKLATENRRNRQKAKIRQNCLS